MKLSPSCDVQRFSADEIRCILRNLKVTNRVHKSSYPGPVPSQMRWKQKHRMLLTAFTCLHLHLALPMLSMERPWVSGGASRDRAWLRARRVPVGVTPLLRSIQSPIQCAYRTLSREVKCPGREVGLSTKTSAEVKNTRIYTAIPHTSSWSGA
jgi:hypothetical protein